MLNQIRIVLVHTSHPGNIGSTARAMKTMGLSDLVLVKPKSFPDPKAEELACGATDILQMARVVEDLPEALQGCRFVFGLSARTRELGLPNINPRQAAVRAKLLSLDAGSIAFVFGCEKSGLSNEQLVHCQQQVIIPTNPDYASLNLSQAVQVICYECRMQEDDSLPLHPKEDALACYEDLQNFYQHLYDILIRVGFLNEDHPKKCWERMHRLFSRAALEESEVNLLRGLLTSIERSTYD